MSTIDSATQRTNTVSLADEEGVKKVLLRSVLGLWDFVSTHLNDEDGTGVLTRAEERDLMAAASVGDMARTSDDVT